MKFTSQATINLRCCAVAWCWAVLLVVSQLAHGQNAVGGNRPLQRLEPAAAKSPLETAREAGLGDGSLGNRTHSKIADQDTLPGDRLTLKLDGREVSLIGDVLIDGGDGSLYFQQDNGRIWFVKPDQVVSRTDSPLEAAPATFEAMQQSLLEELPAGFQVLKTEHYLIAYQTELAYAKWLAKLYETRLYKAFDGFWQRKKKLPLTDPKFPLVVIVFGSKAEYDRYLKADLGPGQEIIAYYNFQSNRVAMYDLTVGGRQPGEAVSDRRIEEILQNPAAIFQVATIIHEGTHQLAFNRGIQTRFADTPLWLNEGLAMYFEAPDVKNKSGWRRPGLVFDQRLHRFLAGLPHRPNNAIEILITDDDRLRDAETAADGYAEAWAFNHFLLNRRSKQYVMYLQALSKRPPLSTADAAKRLADFKQYFGDDLRRLERDFLKHIQRLK